MSALEEQKPSDQHSLNSPCEKYAYSIMYISTTWVYLKLVCVLCIKCTELVQNKVYTVKLYKCTDAMYKTYATFPAELVDSLILHIFSTTVYLRLYLRH